MCRPDEVLDRQIQFPVQIRVWKTRNLADRARSIRLNAVLKARQSGSKAERLRLGATKSRLFAIAQQLFREASPVRRSMVVGRLTCFPASENMHAGPVSFIRSAKNDSAQVEIPLLEPGTCMNTQRTKANRPRGERQSKDGTGRSLICSFVSFLTPPISSAAQTVFAYASVTSRR